jgi:[ribosomal protein S18]-alanine N-acetyltransferase
MDIKDKISIRNLSETDKAAVLELFSLNTPKYFSPEEKNDLIYYLENEIEQYFVMVMENELVGCGGINFSDDKTVGIISWDMIHPLYQGKSLGGVLLDYRIKYLKNIRAIRKIRVRTTQLVYRFYEKFGFALTEIIENYWAEGFHLYSMEINIKEWSR